MKRFSDLLKENFEVSWKDTIRKKYFEEDASKIRGLVLTIAKEGIDSIKGLPLKPQPEEILDLIMQLVTDTVGEVEGSEVFIEDEEPEEIEEREPLKSEGEGEE